MSKKLYLITTTLLLLLALVPVSASAQRRNSELDKQREVVNNIGKQLTQVNGRVKALESEKGAAANIVTELNREINIRVSLINETEYEIDLINKNIASLNCSIDSLEQSFHQSRELYAEMVRQSYRMSRRSSYATYIFSSTSLEEFYRRMSNVERFAERYKSIAKIASEQSKELAVMRESLELQLAELDAVTESLQTQRNNLNKDKIKAQSVYSELTEQEREALNKKKELEKEYKRADEKLKKILAENTVGGNFSSNTRGLKLPIDGGKIRPLQPNMIEITGRRGSPVKCVEEGTVGDITLANGGNYIIKVAHGKDFFTIYTNVSNVCVEVGQKIKENEQIGVVGVFVDFDGSERSYIQFMVYNHRKGELEEVMKFFSSKK